MTKNDNPQRGDVYWIDLEPTIGTEIKKIRPCIIISNNIHNKKMPRIVAIPVTSNITKLYAFENIITINGKAGKVMVDQIRCFDKQRLRGKLCTLNFEALIQIEASIKLCLGLS